MDESESLLKFPCHIDVKAMGLADSAFEDLVLEIVRRHAPETTSTSLRSRPSSGGKYVSITIGIEASSRAQMDSIYQDLSANKQVLMAL